MTRDHEGSEEAKIWDEAPTLKLLPGLVERALCAQVPSCTVFS